MTTFSLPKFLASEKDVGFYNLRSLLQEEDLSRYMSKFIADLINSEMVITDIECRSSRIMLDDDKRISWKPESHKLLNFTTNSVEQESLNSTAYKGFAIAKLSFPYLPGVRVEKKNAVNAKILLFPMEQVMITIRPRFEKYVMQNHAFRWTPIPKDWACYDCLFSVPRDYKFKFPLVNLDESGTDELSDMSPIPSPSPSR